MPALIASHSFTEGDAGRHALTVGPAGKLRRKLKAAVGLMSAPGVAQEHNVPTRLADRLRRRFVSVPAECERPAQANDNVALRPQVSRTKTPPPRVPKWPCNLLLLRIQRLLLRTGVVFEKDENVRWIEEMDRQAWVDRHRMEDERESIERVRAGQQLPFFYDHAFTTPLATVLLYASTTVDMDGYRHDLPIALVAPVEQLYRKGIHEGCVFREQANHKRYADLVHDFNLPPMYGHGSTLRTESTADVAALLDAWLSNIPGGVVPHIIYEPLYKYCVAPSIRAKKQSDLDELDPANAFQLSNDELRRISVAQDFLRLLPTHSLSVLVYLFAFFTKLPLGPDNLDLDEIADHFGKALFGGIFPEARETMLWLLERWGSLSSRLLCPETLEDYEWVCDTMPSEVENNAADYPV